MANTTQKHPFYLIALLIAVGLALIFLAHASQPASGQAKNACLDCHEIQAKHPVLAAGPWHSQHGETVQCAVCHAGDPAQDVAEAAHVGVIRNPLEQAELRCALCHPADFSGFAATYQPLITPTSTPTLKPTDTPAPPTETPLPTKTSAPGETPEPTDTPLPPTDTPLPPTDTPLPPPPPAPTGWLAVLAFARGPFFRFSFWFFAVGMLARLWMVLRLGWKHRRPVNKPGGPMPVLISFARGLLVFPYIPRIRSAFRHSPLIFIAGGLFHLGLLGVMLFSRTHMLAWKEMIGFGWPTLDKAIVGWLSIIGILAMLVLLVNRLTSQVLRLISTAGEWLNWLLVFIAMLTGWILAQRLAANYEAMFAIHMLSVNLLLIWIPFSRISHFMFYFIARAVHGAEFERRIPVG